MFNSSSGTASVLFGTHVTTGDRAGSIVRDGFRCHRSGFGTGIYLTVDDFYDAIPFYLRQRTDSRDATILICAVDVRHPLVIEMPAYDIEDLEHEQLGELVACYVNGGVPTERGASDISFAAGHDVLVLYDAGAFVAELGGDQVIVADPAAITVVDTIHLASFPDDDGDHDELCAHVDATIRMLAANH